MKVFRYFALLFLLSIGALQAQIPVPANVPLELPHSIEGKKIELNPAPMPFNPAVETTFEYSGDLEHSRIGFWPGGAMSSKGALNGNFSEKINLGKTCDKCTPILETGSPDLGKLTTSILVPDLAEMELKVVNAEYVEYQNIEVNPSKGNLFRNVDPSKVVAVKGDVYSNNGFWPGKLASLREPYIFRDHRAQVVEAFPFQYNPVTKILRVYTHIEVEVSSTGNAGKNLLERNQTSNGINPEFDEAYKRNFINYGFGGPQYPILNDDQGKMLIISHGEFIDELTPFTEWKKQKGIAVEVVDVATIGGASQIKSYVEGYYNTFGLTYLLLVGDAAQVATFPGVYGDSDNEYGFISGDDFYPEIFVGRFSAETANEVSVQVNRTLLYEKTPDLSGNWASSGLCVGSDQGPGDDNEYDYQHERNIRSQLMNFTYANVHELYDGSQGGSDSAGDPTAQMMFDIVQEGIGIINYTGHGSDLSCSTTGFSVDEVDNLTNYGHYPFFFSVACVNGNFSNQTCFAEAWLRAGSANPEQPFGAIATLMSTINQSWDPPMEGQDEMNALLTGNVSGNVRHTFGGIAMNGCMKMNDTYGVNGFDMTETWTLFGDPSVVVRTAAPTEMAVSHLLMVGQWASSLNVNCDEEGALVSITVNGEIIGTGIVIGGASTISFAPLSTTQSLLVTVTAFNKLPYQGNVAVIALTSLLEPGHPLFETWPNPFSETIICNIPGREWGQLALLNSLGQVMWRVETGGKERVELDTPKLESGVYTLVFTTEEQVFSQKLVCIK